MLDHPKFIEFYNQATPIDVLEQSKIGSRPARRTGKRSLNDLRSIPWVFSWNQARFNLTGWFGSGAALAEFMSQYPEDFDFLKRMAQKWPFLKYSLIQIETNLLNSDPEIMRSFAALVADPNTQSELMRLVIRDYQSCQQQVASLMGASIEDRRTTRLENNRLRGEALAMLHQIQLQSIKHWRGLKEEAPEKAEAMLPRLLLLVNALAGGLKSTG
ncbi:MAG: phosphoenolpyruvate carboxylase [Bacteroidota bacterium]